MLLRLNRNHPTGKFHRIVRDKTGKPKKTLSFSVDDAPVDLAKADLAAVKADIEKGVLIEVDERGKAVPPPEELSEYQKGYADGYDAGLAEASSSDPEEPHDTQDADQE